MYFQGSSPLMGGALKLKLIKQLKEDALFVPIFYKAMPFFSSVLQIVTFEDYLVCYNLTPG